MDELLQVNFGTEEEPQSTVISENMSPEEKKVYINFLKKNMDALTWTYTKMPDLDLEISMHCLSVRPDKRPVKQGARQMHPDSASKIKAEVGKLIKANFIKEVQYFHMVGQHMTSQKEKWTDSDMHRLPRSK